MMYLPENLIDRYPLSISQRHERGLLKISSRLVEKHKYMETSSRGIFACGIWWPARAAIMQ